MVLALIGNQNCGKTTLFNRLTGSNQHIGNFPGVTVEKKEGTIKQHKDVTVVDLPGIYSLSPYTAEEVVTRNFLINEKPDGIINIIDATNIERNLYLTIQLLELHIPTVLAINIMDELTASGGSVDIAAMEELLGIPIVPISASKGEGISELVTRVLATTSNKVFPKKCDFCTGDVHKAIHAVAHIIEDNAENAGIPVRFAASKLIEGDEPLRQTLKLSSSQTEIIESLATDMEHTTSLDREAAMADMRYNFIEMLCRQTVNKPKKTKEQERSAKIDSILTNKYLAIPIFIGIMSLIFWITFGLLGAYLSDMFSLGIEWVTNLADKGLTAININPTIHSLIIDGIFAGVGSVLSFLPTIILLFFFLSLLEDSGYMARIAFVTDKLLRKIGLSGRSFVPMLIGFGCSVPAIMATRTLSSERDRKLTIVLTPFMSCSAKLPVYAVFTAAFFPKHQALVMILLYLIGIAVSILLGYILKNTAFKGNPVPFVMELPAYRMPSAKTTFRLMWDKSVDFVHKAFTIIFAATIIIWFLQYFDFRFNPVQSASDSMLASVGKLIAPLFAPMGFGDWRIACALITGLTAKEAVISTLAILTESDISTIAATLTGMSLFPSQASVFACLVFILLYMPCVAAFAAVKREYDSFGKTSLIMLSQTAVAWVISFAVYCIGNLVI